jgi:hypothetical protein
MQLLDESKPFNLAVMRELSRQILHLNKICAQLVMRLPDGAPAVDASRPLTPPAVTH